MAPFRAYSWDAIPGRLSRGGLTRGRYPARLTYTYVTVTYATVGKGTLCGDDWDEAHHPNPYPFGRKGPSPGRGRGAGARGGGAG